MMGLIFGIKFWCKQRVYYHHEIQSNIYCEKVDSLQQTLTNNILSILISIYISFGGNDWSKKKVKELFQVICRPKANNFVGTIIVQWRRMVKSTYVIKNRFIRKIFFREIIADTWKYIPIIRCSWRKW